MIKYIEDKKIFHLYNDEISYIIKVFENKEVVQLYFGEKIELDDVDYLYKKYNPSMPITPSYRDYDEGFYLDTVLREYPDFGRGDFRTPAFMLTYKEGDFVSEFKYSHYEIIDSYVEIKNLPHLKAKNSKTLLLYLVDELKNSTIILKYTILDKYNGIIRNTKLIGENIKINKLASVSLDLLDGDYDLISLNGHWGRECNYTREKLKRGIKVIDSKRGSSSATFNPFIALSKHNADFDNGIMYGFNLIYSGNFEASVELNPFNSTRVIMGINSFAFEKEINKSFETPEVLMVFSSKGLNGLSQTYHDIYRDYLLEKKENYVLLNNWEGTYFNFTEEQLLKFIDESYKLGIDLFVLDDGWFGIRNNDNSGLGDWHINYDKLPNGLKALWTRTKEYNMKFGLWFEPEMINEDSDLYRKNKEYIIKTDGRVNHFGRNQLVLDFSKKEVVENIFNQMIEILDNNEIDYIKWDMNRAITGLDKKEKYFEYMLGLYSLLDRLKKRYPNILFEACASGGNRFDPGMLFYMPQIWTSDNTDAVSRIDIQFGTSIPYPISTQGAHISNIPNHQTGRNTSLDFRRNMAMFGTFGYELNPLELTNEDKEMIKKDIKIFKEYKDVISSGDLYRICYDDENMAFNVVSKNKEISLLAYFKKKIKILEEVKRIKIKGLCHSYKYQVIKLDENRNEIIIGTFNGNFLEKFGIYTEFSKATGDYHSDLYIIKKIS